jgi:acetyl esterase/lipase
MTQGALGIGEWVAEDKTSEMQVEEVEVEGVEQGECIGVLGMSGLDRKASPGFWLRHRLKNGDNNSGRKRSGVLPRRRVFLFLAGGGYVTGWPLVHPLIFSYMRALPPSPNQVDEYSLFAPDVRKALDKDRSFPIPVIDALAGWVYLRKNGWKAEDIILLGDSAGGGLCWSLMSYLLVREKLGRWECGGIPKNVVMISVSGFAEVE